MISTEQKQKALRLYRNKTLTIAEIANLTDISKPKLDVIFRQAFKDGTLKPRNEHSALKPRTPNGQGKPRTPTGIGKGGRNHERKKFTDDQERQIAIDYYENGLTTVQIQEKWHAHPVQMQRIKNRFKGIYAPKEPRRCPVVQFDTDGNFIAEFDSQQDASEQTGISKNCIWSCCKGRTQTAGKFVWKYKECEMGIRTHESNSVE